MMLHADEIRILAEAAAEADKAALAVARAEIAELRNELVALLNQLAAGHALNAERLDALAARDAERAEPEPAICWDNLGAWDSNIGCVERGGLVIDDGSTFLAIRDAFGSPRDEPTSWRCIAAGMGEIAADWAPDNDRVVQLEFNHGFARQFLKFDLGPIPLPRGQWDSTRGYAPGDTVAHNGAQWLALRDIAPGFTPPGKVDPAAAWEHAWQLFAARGKTGRPGGKLEGSA